MSAIFSLLPSWVKELLLAILAVLLFLFSGWLYGQHKYRQGEQAVHIAQVTLENKIDLSSKVITADSVADLRPKIQYIQGATITIEKEVTRYVTQQDDSKCPIPNGFVGLWNSTNKMQLPDDSAGVPRGTSDVVLSDVAAQHTREAEICHTNEETLRSIQGWLVKQKALYDNTR